MIVGRAGAFRDGIVDPLSAVVLGKAGAFRDGIVGAVVVVVGDSAMALSPAEGQERDARCLVGLFKSAYLHLIDEIRFLKK